MRRGLHHILLQGDINMEGQLLKLNFLLALILGFVSNHCALAARDALAPAFFVLGDSIMDPGNNNRFITLAKVNYYPYGMDFPGGVPTGRFSNGYNAADYLAFKLGLPIIPAYHNPATKGKKLLQGVNFASGGSGIQSYTGKLYGEVVSMRDQIDNLWDVKKEIIKMIGGAATDDLFAQAAYAVVTGSNDWLLSFFSPIIPIRLSHTPTMYIDILIENLLSQVEAIYEAGGRRIAVAGLPALGCCPSQLLEYKSNGSCVEHINKIASDYNERLIPQVLALNEKLPNASIMYINIYTPILMAAQNPSQFGFKTGNNACCGIGKYKGFLTCIDGLQPCENVEDHFYWDAYHPSHNFYPQLVELLWNNGPPYTYPISLKEVFEPKLKPLETDFHSEL